MQMLEEAVSLAPENVEYQSEMAHQNCMLGNYSDAYIMY